MWDVAGLSLATTISLYITLFIKLYLIRNMITIDRELTGMLVYILCSCSVACVISALWINKCISLGIIRLIIGTIIFTFVYVFLTIVVNRQLRTLVVSIVSGFSNKRRKEE